MNKYFGLLGSILLFITTFTTLTLMALEGCDHGMAEKLYTAITKVAYLNLFSLFFLWLGYKEKDNFTTAIVSISMLGMSWIVVDGYLIFEQVNIRKMAPCFGAYLEDGDYGTLVYFYGPYFMLFYLILIVVLLYYYIIRLDLPYRLKRFR